MSDEWRLTVRDNGRGFDAYVCDGGGGFGLASMRRQAEALGGVLRVRSDDSGTTWRRPCLERETHRGACR